MLKIGVRLPRRFADAGEYLADARALDSAGVDSLWLEDDGDDPWLLLAGIAAVTGGVRLVVPVPAADARAPALEDRVATLGHLSRGRTVLAVDAATASGDVDAAIEVARRSKCGVLLQAVNDCRADGVVFPGTSLESFRARVESFARTEPFELWAAVPMPDDREAWRKVRDEYEAAGATGIIVPSDPRLLDLLRNGDEDDDRSDLGLAQG